MSDPAGELMRIAAAEAAREGSALIKVDDPEIAAFKVTVSPRAKGGYRYEAVYRDGSAWHKGTKRLYAMQCWRWLDAVLATAALRAAGAPAVRLQPEGWRAKVDRWAAS